MARSKKTKKTSTVKKFKTFSDVNVSKMFQDTEKVMFKNLLSKGTNQKTILFMDFEEREFKKSKYRKGKGKKGATTPALMLLLKILPKSPKMRTFITSTVVVDQLKKNKKSLPFTGQIVKHDRYYKII
jgi:hypothetical protein